MPKQIAKCTKKEMLEQNGVKKNIKVILKEVGKYTIVS